MSAPSGFTDESGEAPGGVCLLEYMNVSSSATMQPYPYPPGAVADLLKALSEPRFQTYLTQANGDPEMGMRKYVWNAALASGLHGPVHILEVVLRNAVHDRLKHVRGASWFDLPNLLKGPEAAMVNEARSYIATRGEPATPDKIIAELSFRFWVGIFSRKYDRLWISSLQAVFDPRPVRHELHEKLDRLRTLRNRMAHHEPILHRHLMADLADIKQIVGSISPAVLDWLNWHEQATGRFATPAREIDLF